MCIRNKGEDLVFGGLVMLVFFCVWFKFGIVERDGREEWRELVFSIGVLGGVCCYILVLFVWYFIFWLIFVLGVSFFRGF